MKNKGNFKSPKHKQMKSPPSAGNKRRARKYRDAEISNRDLINRNIEIQVKSIKIPLSAGKMISGDAEIYFCTLII